MDPDRKRKIRLVVALSAAVLLAAALVYTSFSASSEARAAVRARRRQRRQLRAHRRGRRRARSSTRASELHFEVADRDDPSATIPVVYTGTVPDPFRDGREVIVTGTVKDGTFVAEQDSLITKCPSKFADEAAEDPEHVVIQ